MGKRKIALVASAWDGELLESSIKGIKARLAGSGMDLHVFLCLPSFGLNAPENFGNFNIFALPDYEEYEGFIFSVNVVNGYEMIKTYHSALLNCKKPMVSLDCEMEGIPSVVPDGYDAEYRMVEHLIVQHGCRKINYVGGPSDNEDNILRKKAYTDALTAHGIPVEEDRIRDYNFLERDGYRAYSEFKELGIETPDAVVCANDSMSYGYCQAAEEDGKHPPKDFRIAGYDNDENSRTFTPMISTVDKNFFDMGYLGCDVLMRLMNGEKVDAVISYGQKLALRGSCGCYAPEELINRDQRELQLEYYYKIKEEKFYYETINSIRQNLALSDSEGMFNWYMFEALRKFDIYGYCMCVNQSIYYGTQPTEVSWEVGYDEEQYVLSGMKHGVSQEAPMMISRKDMVPEYLRQNDDEVHDYIFVPLQKMGACLGYFVMVDASGMLVRRVLLNMAGAIGNAYSNLRNLENLRKMNKRLDSVYVMDAMTGMYNRFGYMRDGYAMFEKSKAYGKPLMVMFMDMNGLKAINDIHGHSHGDNAIIMFADVLKKCVGEEKIAVRYGGDEFLILGQVEDKDEAEAFKEELLRTLKDANETSGLPYVIEASIGYVLSDVKGVAELDDYVKAADALMYEVKKQSRKDRLSYSPREDNKKV